MYRKISIRFFPPFSLPIFTQKEYNITDKRNKLHKIKIVAETSRGYETEIYKLLYSHRLKQK